MGILASLENYGPMSDYGRVPSYDYGPVSKCDTTVEDNLNEKLLELLRDAKWNMEEVLKVRPDHPCKGLLELTNTTIEHIKEASARAVTRKDIDKAQKLCDKLDEAFVKEWDTKSELHAALHMMVDKTPNKSITYGSGFRLKIIDGILYFRATGENEDRSLWEIPTSHYVELARDFLKAMKKKSE